MTALDYFDVPDDGAQAHQAGYAQADNPHGFSTPEGIEWARRWGSAEVSSRRAAGTYGATDDEYRAGGLVPPEYIVGPGGSLAMLGNLSGVSSIYRDALREAEATARAMHYAAAMTRRIIGTTSFRFDPGAIAALYGVPRSILGFGPVEPVVDEPKSPAHPAGALEWKTTKRKDLVDGAVNADPKDRVLRRYLLDQPGPLEVELDPPFEREVYGIVPTGVRRLEQMRATMQEPRPALRAPKHLGTAPATRTQTARSRRRNP